jgi:eukaryotic-like serine/threonine-protein kinase
VPTRGLCSSPSPRCEVKLEIIAAVKYDKIERIGAGHGQNSNVYRAFDHHRNTVLAIKEVEKKRIGDPARFFAEARALHASANPRVVPIDWAADGIDHVVIAMPLMSGGSLATAIESRPLSAIRLLQIAQDLCEGVAQVHVAKYVHLDIKPSNVLFDANGRAAISDFGQALKLNYSGVADARDHALYPCFTPPEIIKHKGQVTPAADVYQIGLTLYRAVNGEPCFSQQWNAVEARPWPGANDAIVRGEFPDRTFLPHVPLGIRKAILGALDPDPQRRPVAARMLAEQLARVDVKDDWQPEIYERDVARWRLRRVGSADVLVLRLGALPAARVEIWTETPAGQRRKRPEVWFRGIRTARQLRMALSKAFRAALT